MAFDPKILDSLKDEIRNKKVIDPTEVLLKEKVKGKSAGLARLVEDLYTDKPQNNNSITKFNEVLQRKQVNPELANNMNNMGYSNMPQQNTQHQAPVLQEFNDYKPYNGIEYNEYQDEDDAAMEHRIRLAEQELLNKRKQPMNEYSDVQTFRPQPTQQIHQPQQRQQHNYQHNMDVREELLSLFAKDYILKTIKEYIKEDSNFRATIIDIVKSSFSKKKNE
jgi:hypothetical protein